MSNYFQFHWETRFCNSA